MGRSTWTSAALAYQPLQADAQQAYPFALVASDEILDLFGLSAASRQAISGADGPVLLTQRSYTDLVLPGVVAPELQVDLPWPLISPEAAQNAGWVVVPQAVMFGVAGHDLTQKDWDALSLLSQDSNEGLAYVGVEESGQTTTWAPSNYARNNQGFQLTATQVRITLVLVPLLLVMLLVSVGMALWAVESRDERDVLVAVGASPASLARVAGWRAGGLTFGAMVFAVPTGLCCGMDYRSGGARRHRRAVVARWPVAVRSARGHRCRGVGVQRPRPTHPPCENEHPHRRLTRPYVMP